MAIQRYRIEFAASALEDLRSIPKREVDHILRKVQRLENGLHGNIKRLQNVRILDFSERGQERKTEFVEACDFMGIKPKNSSWNHGLQQLEPRITAVGTTDYSS